VNVVTYAITLYCFRHPSRLGWVWIWSTLAINLVLSLATGTRGAALLFLTLFMLAYYATRRYHWRWVLLGALVFGVLAPSATLLRSILPQNQAVDAGTRFAAVQTSMNETLQRPVSELVAEISDLFQSRQASLLLITASVMQQHPATRPFVGAEALLEFVSGLVPRILWPGKPEGNSELYQITQTYVNPSAVGFSAIGLPADIYRMGGWGLLVVLFLGLGGFMAWIYCRGPVRETAAGKVTYMLFLGAITYDTNILAVLYFLIEKSPLIWIINRWIADERSAREDSL
jgi:hypothetical protein